MTPEVIASRPEWNSTFYGKKIRTSERTKRGYSVEGHIEMLDAARIDRAFLLAPKMGRRGLPGSWELDAGTVSKVVDEHPDRFSGILGINPYDGLRGVRELERAVRDHGFIGAHIYPHWFELAPDDRRFYPFYAKCAELDIPVQIQVGHCLKYTDEQPLPSVGRPFTLDTVACDLPELKLVGIHLGWPWTDEMISVAYKHPNVYVAGDAYAPRYWPESFVHFANSWGKEKVVFGTDWPIVGHARARQEIEELKLRPEAAALILGGNALRLYDIGG